VGRRELQEAWLLDRAPGLGFRIPDDPVDVQTDDGGVAARRNLAVTERRANRFERHSDGQSRQVTLSTARFDGVLEITDVDALRHALCRGVGRGKAYGCGLLTLAPLT
jgi:CRISPR system Cascade subunit CasE